MSQLNLQITESFSAPPSGMLGVGFIENHLVRINGDGSHTIIGASEETGLSINIIANLGVGLEVDLPGTFVQGDIYVAGDTNVIYTAIDDVSWNTDDIVEGQFITDSLESPEVIYQFVEGVLISVAGASYTFGNGLTEVVGVVSLGGALTSSITIDPNGYSFRIIGDGIIRHEINDGAGATAIIDQSAGVISLTTTDTGNNGYISISDSGVFISGGTSEIAITDTYMRFNNSEANIFAEYTADYSGQTVIDNSIPNVLWVNTQIDSKVAGLLDYRGAYDASGNTFPTSGGSGTAGAILTGDMWIISVAGTLDGNDIQVGDYIIANTDTPGQTGANWDTLNTNISYVPEDVANKEDTTLDTSSTLYPTNRLVREYTDGNIASQSVDALVSTPTVTEDGYVIAWNETNSEYELVDGGGYYTFENGVYENLGVVGLGGVMTGNVNIGDATDTHAFTLTNHNNAINLTSYAGTTPTLLSSIIASSAGDTAAYAIMRVLNDTDENKLEFSTGGGIILTDGIGSKGITYLTDYSANFTAYSLIDKNYDDSHLGGQDVDALVITPTATEDGYVIAWNNTNSEYELVENGSGGLPSGAQGEILYHNGTSWVVLGVGAADDVLTTHGASQNPTWETPSGASYTFENGLTESTGNVIWGGVLTEDVNISGAFDINLGDSTDGVTDITGNASGIVDIRGGVLAGAWDSRLYLTGVEAVLQAVGSVELKLEAANYFITFYDREVAQATLTNSIPFAIQATVDYGNGNGTTQGAVIDQFRAEFIDDAIINGLVELKADIAAATGALPSGIQGELMYHNGTTWVVLGTGTDGYILTTHGVDANPTWAVAGSGTVDTSGTPVTNDFARFTDADTIEGREPSEVRTDLGLVIGTNVLAEQTIGIADNNLLEVDGSPNDDEYARFTANGLEGRTESEFKADFNLEIGTDVQGYKTAASSLPSTSGAGDIDFSRVNDYYSETAITADVTWGLTNIAVDKVMAIDVNVSTYAVNLVESGITFKGAVNASGVVQGLDTSASNLISIWAQTSTIMWVSVLVNEA